MAYTASAQVNQVLTLQQIFDTTSLPGTPENSAGGNTLIHNGLNLDVSLPISGVPMTAVQIIKKALSGGSGTVDLTSLTGTLGEAVTLNGLKVQAVTFKNPTENANNITIGEGASNGHELLGNGWTLTLPPNSQMTLYIPEGSPDVGASTKTWDLSGTGSQFLMIGIAAG
jgi:hypothetical protein